MQLPKIYAQQVKRATIDMSLSENPLGCSPAVVKTLKSLTSKDVNSYPDEQDLVKAIATNFGVQKESVLLGTGSEQLIKLICQTFLFKGALVLVQQGSFPLFTKEVLLSGGRVKFFNPTSRQKTDGVKLLILCNPNNPTGEALSASKLGTMVRDAKSKLVIIDEANADFTGKSFIPEAVKKNNCLVLRTFSKAFGLAGMRVGFAVGSAKIIGQLKEAQQPFPVSNVGIKLATAALGDRKFLNKTLAFVRRERSFLTKNIKNLGLDVKPSQTNNLFVITRNSRLLAKELARRDVSVVESTFFPGIREQGFRIAVQDQKTNQLFLKKLREALACVNKKKLLRSKEEL